MTVNLNDPYEKALFEAIQSVYDRHDHTKPLNYVNTVEWVEAIKPVVKNIVQEAITDALHPEFGWYWREQNEQ